MADPWLISDRAGDRRERTAARRSFGVTSVLLLLLTIYMVVKFVNADLKDAEVWYDAGRRVLDGETLAGLPHYRYPPTFAVLVAPLCALGIGSFYFLWYALNVWLFGACLRLTRGICSPNAMKCPARYVWLPTLLVAAFAVDNLVLGQTNILVMALIYWCLLEDLRGRQWLSGLPLGAAIAIKAFPLPLIAYLLYRGRARAAASAVLSCLFFLFIMPAPVRGLQRNLDEVAHWGRRVVVPYISRGQPGDWGQHATDFRSQSLSAVVHRYLTRVDAQVAAREGRPIFVNVADLRPEQANAVVVGIFALLGIGFLAACGLRRPRRPIELAAEYSLAVVLLLLTSPLSWTYSFVMLLLPVTLTVCLLDHREMLLGRSASLLRAGLWAVGIAAVLLVSDHARALGNLSWGTVLLFVALASARRALRTAADKELTRTAPASSRKGPARDNGEGTSSA